MLVAVVLVAGAGCADDAQQVAERPWAAEFQRVYDEAPNDFVRSIVADGELTLVEMREAAARTNECLASVGSPATIDEGEGGAFMLGFYHRAGYEGHEDMAVHLGGPEIRDATFACEFEYFMDLWVLWDTIRVNPHGENFDDLVAECLIRNGLVDATLTGQAFREAALACDFFFEHDPDNPLTNEEITELSRLHWEENPDCRTQLPGPVYLDEGVAWDCQMDPLNS